MSKILTYNGTNGANGPSYIGSTYSEGKQFYLRTIMRYAIALNDTIAFNYLVESLGGMDSLVSDINEISGYISYNDNKIYKDYRGLEFSSTGMSSCYDFANFLEYLYSGYTNHPEVYQGIVNDMSVSETSSPIKDAFGEEADVLHLLGRNTGQNAYMDIAIIDCEEPIALVIYCEASTPDSAGSAIYTLASYTYDFVHACHYK